MRLDVIPSIATAFWWLADVARVSARALRVAPVEGSLRPCASKTGRIKQNWLGVREGASMNAMLGTLCMPYLSWIFCES